MKLTTLAAITERKNIDVVRTICAILDKVVEQKPGNISQFADLITFVKDRPGHDLRLCDRCGKNSARSRAGYHRRRSRAGLRKPSTGT